MLQTKKMGFKSQVTKRWEVKRRGGSSQGGACDGISSLIGGEWVLDGRIRTLDPWGSSWKQRQKKWQVNQVWSSIIILCAICSRVAPSFLNMRILFFSCSFFIFNWGIVAVQCLAGFCCTTMEISYKYTFMCTSLPLLLSWSSPEYQVELPVLHSHLPLATYFTDGQLTHEKMLNITHY